LRILDEQDAQLFNHDVSRRAPTQGDYIP